MIGKKLFWPSILASAYKETLLSLAHGLPFINLLTKHVHQSVTAESEEPMHLGDDCSRLFDNS